MSAVVRPATAEEAVTSAAPIQTRVVLSAAVGNALEFYDFVVYSFFSVYIGRAFFPSDSPAASLLASLAVFGVGFVARPIGALVMGRYADRRGRRPALLVTMALIASSTVAIAALPGYTSIGMAAPLLMVVLRLVQGFAYGAEIGPATAYLLEAAPPSRAGLYCSSLFAGQGAAACLAGLLGSGMVAALTTAQMQLWGWRLPFVAGVLLIPLAVYLRRHMPETLEPRVASKRSDSGAMSRTRSWLKVLQLTVVLLGGTVANYVFTYMSTYAATTLKVPMSVALLTASVVGAATFFFGLLGGWLSDLYGRRPILIASRVACTVLALPAFQHLVAQPSVASLWLITGALAAINALTGGALFAAIPESFDFDRRATAMSVIYASGVAIFGGSTQFIVAWLIERTSDPSMPGWYMVATGVLASIATLMVRETRWNAASKSTLRTSA